MYTRKAPQHKQQHKHKFEENSRDLLPGDLPVNLHAPLQQVLDGLEDEVLIIDRDYRVYFANFAARKNLPGTIADPAGRFCYELLGQRGKPCAPPLWTCPLNDIFQSGNPVSIDYPGCFLSAESFPGPGPGPGSFPRKCMQIYLYPLFGSNAQINAVLEVRKDITLPRELESQIEKFNYHISAINRISQAVSEGGSFDAILNVCLDTALNIVTGGRGGILLLDEGTQLLRYRVHCGLSDRYVEQMQMAVGEGIAGSVAQTGQPVIIEDISLDPRAAYPDLISAEGLKGFVSIPLKSKQRVVGVMNIASRTAGRFTEKDLNLLDVIAHHIGISVDQAILRERLESALERSRQLLKHALNAQEEERKRIARELHDETTQAITSLTLSLQALSGMARNMGINDSQFMERLEKAHQNAVHTGKELVKLMKELRPTLLDALGMAAAIQGYAKETLQAKNINVLTDLDAADKCFPPEVEITMFRIAQGLIGNILEHSQAQNAFIRMRCGDRKCFLHIEDDGKGFEANKLKKVESSGRGAGLFTVMERLRLIGGVCCIESAPGKGTRVTIKVPRSRSGNVEEKDKGTDSG